MPAFQYRAARADGTALEGWIEETDEGSARAQLERQGCLIFDLRSRGLLPSCLTAGVKLRRGLPLQEFLVFNQEFLALIKAGLPILRMLDLLIDRTRHASFQATLRTVRQDVRGGASLSDALSRHPAYFPELYIASVRAGEQSGNLADVFQRYIAYQKMVIGLRQKMAKALTYPAFLVVVGVAVVAFLLTYVLPTFSAVYGESAQALPAATRGLIALVQAVESHLLLGLTALIAAAAGIRLWVRTPSGRTLVDRMLLRLPLVGEVLVNHHTVQFSRTLATVLEAGSPLTAALPIVRGAVSNRLLSEGLAEVMQKVRDGGSLSAALADLKSMPRLAVEMIAVGEETGSLETMLGDVADLFEGDLDQRLTRLTTWIEPALLLIMGAIVGAIVIIMYLPVFQMAGTIK